MWSSPTCPDACCGERVAAPGHGGSGEGCGWWAGAWHWGLTRGWAVEVEQCRREHPQDWHTVPGPRPEPVVPVEMAADLGGCFEMEGQWVAAALRSDGPGSPHRAFPPCGLILTRRGTQSTGSPLIGGCCRPGRRASQGRGVSSRHRQPLWTTRPRAEITAASPTGPGPAACPLCLSASRQDHEGVCAAVSADPGGRVACLVRDRRCGGFGSGDSVLAPGHRQAEGGSQGEGTRCPAGRGLPFL